jgi:hypothetical protein
MMQGSIVRRIGDHGKMDHKVSYNPPQNEKLNGSVWRRRLARIQAGAKKLTHIHVPSIGWDGQMKMYVVCLINGDFRCNGAQVHDCIRYAGFPRA